MQLTGIQKNKEQSKLKNTGKPYEVVTDKLWNTEDSMYRKLGMGQADWGNVLLIMSLLFIDI